MLFMYLLNEAIKIEPLQRQGVKSADKEGIEGHQL